MVTFTRLVFFFLWQLQGTLQLTIFFPFSMALAENCNTQPLIELVQSKVEGAEAIRHHGKEMAFSLPVEQVSCFPGKFNEQLTAL